MRVHAEKVSYGWALFADEAQRFKLAVVQTHEHRGLYRGGVGVEEALPRASWLVHWVNPLMGAEAACAVAEFVRGLGLDAPPG